MAARPQNDLVPAPAQEARVGGAAAAIVPVVDDDVGAVKRVRLAEDDPDARAVPVPRGGADVGAVVGRADP